MSAPDLARILRDKQASIIARFVAEVERAALSPSGTARSLLVDHVPKFLDEIVAELAEGRAVRASQDSVDTSASARKHGEQRWELGYDPEALVREYGVLRHCILLAVKEANASLSVDEFDILAKCLSVGVAQAVTAYVAHRDAEADDQRSKLAFLAEAGQILTSSLDYHATLTRIARLMVPRMADWCTIHLEGRSVEETPISHVDPAKIETLRAIYRRYPFDVSSALGFPRVVETGEPSFVPEVDPKFWESVAASPEQLEQLEQLKTLGAVSWIIVPLGVQGHVFGALTLGYSESGRRYTQSDLALASELARRAAAAIDNARLYELSQSERSRVEAATRAKDEFVAMLSHELRTPLNAVLGWLRLMRAGGLSDSKREHAFDVIERNAQAQNQLVADLLDISRIITGKIRLNPSQMDLVNVVEMAVEGVRPAADAKRIRLQVDVQREGAIMRGDGDRLQQVVWNLLANAVKFTPKNGTVQIRVQRVDSDYELTIVDDGEGIAAQFLPHVFDSFRQADSSISRVHGGLGIGLSIAKHIVELHGGSIEAESKGPGQGATFRARLPISPLVSTTMGISRVRATSEAESAAALAGNLEGLRVLVVDDEPDARELITYVVEAVGAEVRVAGSAGEALNALQTFVPHVIISDIGMPGEDGYALIRSIRTLSSDELKNIPAIALTAFARNEDRTRALIAGFNMHMAKPVEPSALVNALVELSGRLPR